MPDQVSTWANNGVEGLSTEVSDMLYENEITGRELLALSREDDLKMMGMKKGWHCGSAIEGNQLTGAYQPRLRGVDRTRAPIALARFWTVFA